MKKRNILISLMLLFPASLFSQMTLRDCLIFARDNAHANLINNMEVRKAEIDAKLAGSPLMPYVGFSASGNMSFGRNIDPETNTYDNRQTVSTGFGLQMSMPLFDGLVNFNNLKAAQTARLRMQKNAIVEQDRISIEVISAFYEVSYCKAMVRQMEEQLKRDCKDLDGVMRQEELGTKSGADVAEIKALVANDEYELLNRENLLRKAYLTLRSKMGMELSSEPIELIEEEGIEEIMTADASHPKIAEAELLIKEMRYKLRAAKGQYFPTLSFTGGISTSYYKMVGSDYYTPNFRKQWHDNMGEYIGVAVSIPLFDGLSTVNSVKYANINLKESELKLEQTKYELERETIEAELSYNSACREFGAARRRVEAEEVAYRGVRRKFELGMSSAVDLYTSAAKLSAAIANMEGKRIQRIISLITLNYCKGGQLIDRNGYRD
ncbi:MAG: TolC family protein [Bacteroides sp.]|nr:TolC family protein [Bacteroides sp.]